MGNKPQQGQTSDVIRVRYDKLQALRDAGRDTASSKSGISAIS